MFQEVASFIINCLWTHKSLLDYRETSHLQDMIDEKFGVGSDLVGSNNKKLNSFVKKESRNYSSFKSLQILLPRWKVSFIK